MNLLRSSSPAYVRSDRLFDSEEGSDVTFLVGYEPDAWRFPGHRGVLSKANPVFKAMLAGPETTIAITDIDSRAFDLLLRYLYNEDVQLQSVHTALYTFYAAQKYMCTGLMIECVQYLDRNLNTENVLLVFQEMRIHSGQRAVEDPWAPSAPPYHQVVNNSKDPNDNFDSTLSLASSLVHNCLLYVDKNADRILADESIEDLSADALHQITHRDTLYVSSEIVVYNALERWVSRECKRQQLELTPESKRTILGDDLLWTCRFLLMSEREFFSGPASGDLLERNESTSLMNSLLGIPNPSLSRTLEPHVLATITRPRVKPTAHPHPIPHKSRHFFSSSGHRHEGSKLKPKKQKKQRRKEKKKEGNGSPGGGKCSGSCVADCILRALSCLFD